MSRKKELQDCAIVAALSGQEDISCAVMSIQDDYFKREYRENLRMSCVTSWRPHRPRHDKTDYEKAYWTNVMALQELEALRPNSYEEEKEGHLEPNYDEDKFEPWIIKEVVKL
jgi:hypothetical protein